MSKIPLRPDIIFAVCFCIPVALFLAGNLLSSSELRVWAAYSAIPLLLLGIGAIIANLGRAPSEQDSEKRKRRMEEVLSSVKASPELCIYVIELDTTSYRIRYSEDNFHLEGPLGTEVKDSESLLPVLLKAGSRIEIRRTGVG